MGVSAEMKEEVFIWGELFLELWISWKIRVLDSPYKPLPHPTYCITIKKKGKDSDAGRDWGQEEKGTTEDEMAGWHHWLDGRESEWTPGVGDGQGDRACCDSWGRKEWDMTGWLNWTELTYCQFVTCYLVVCIVLLHLFLFLSISSFVICWFSLVICLCSFLCLVFVYCRVWFVVTMVFVYADI